MVVDIIITSTGGNDWPVSGSEEGGVVTPPNWQGLRGLRGAAAGRRKNFR